MKCGFCTSVLEAWGLI